MRARRTAAIAIAALAAAAGGAWASAVLPLSPIELEAGAERVVVARVERVEPRWAGDGTRIESVVALRTDEGEALTIVQPGGDLGRVKQIVVGMPTYRVGERARFYLRHNADGASWRVYGWDQGKWPELVIA